MTTPPEGHSVPYAVGYGKPPVHTQFQKGKSANPGGKPGPAKYLRQRLNVALREALEKNTQDLAAARPANALCAVARQLALDATFGRIASQRFMVELLDREMRDNEARGGRDTTADALPAFIPAPTFGLGLSEWKELISLVQGKKQGTDNRRIRLMYEIFEQELAGAEAEEEERNAKLAAAAAPATEARVLSLGTPVTVARRDAAPAGTDTGAFPQSG